MSAYQKYLFIFCHQNLQLNNKSTTCYIPVLMASTGSSLDALMAGRIPEMRPIMAAKPVPKRIFPSPKTNSNSNTRDIIMAISQTIIMPIIPPSTERIMDSNKN